MTNEDISMSKRVIIIPNIGWIDWKALCRKMIWNTLYQCSDKIVYFYQSTSEKIMVICKMEIIHKIFIWFTKKSSSEKEGKHLRFSQYKPKKMKSSQKWIFEQEKIIKIKKWNQDWDNKMNWVHEIFLTS